MEYLPSNKRIKTIKSKQKSEVTFWPCNEKLHKTHILPAKSPSKAFPASKTLHTDKHDRIYRKFSDFTQNFKGTCETQKFLQ